MILRDVVDHLQLTVVCGQESLDTLLTGACVSDMLSDVMASAPMGCLWITHQVHENVVAIAFFKDLAAIIFPNDLQPDDETVNKAIHKKVVLLRSSRSTYELAGLLYALKIPGSC